MVYAKSIGGVGDYAIICYKYFVFITPIKKPAEAGFLQAFIIKLQQFESQRLQYAYLRSQLLDSSQFR
jgi:hypothetical protein